MAPANALAAARNHARRLREETTRLDDSHQLANYFVSVKFKLVAVGFLLAWKKIAFKNASSRVRQYGTDLCLLRVLY